MPRCWKQDGDNFYRNTYWDDPIPLKVQQASEAVDALAERLRALGVVVSLEGEAGSSVLRKKLVFRVTNDP